MLRSRERLNKLSIDERYCIHSFIFIIASFVIERLPYYATPSMKHIVGLGFEQKMSNIAATKLFSTMKVFHCLALMSGRETRFCHSKTKN
jgi:hypothetical protein